MSISDTTENAILNLVFSATTWANYAINATSSPETNIVVALHTADPTDSGTQSSSETTYTPYARGKVAGSARWTTSSAGSVSPAGNIDFVAGTGGSGTINFFSTGKSGGGTTAILWSGGVSPTIAAGNGVTPRLTT